MTKFHAIFLIGDKNTAATDRLTTKAACCVVAADLPCARSSSAPVESHSPVGEHVASSPGLSLRARTIITSDDL